MAQRAAQFAADQGYDTTYWGPEIEFFVFDGIRLVPSADSARNPWSGAGYEIISREAPWSDSGGKEFPIRFKEGYYPAPPVDRDRKSTRLNSSHVRISYAVFCL